MFSFAFVKCFILKEQQQESLIVQSCFLIQYHFIHTSFHKKTTFFYENITLTLYSTVHGSSP